MIYWFIAHLGRAYLISHASVRNIGKQQLLANLKKCEFSYQSLNCLGCVIGGGELKVDPMNMDTILKWLVPTNVTNIRNFIGATQYLHKFIAFFSLYLHHFMS